jgi:hypothetical protein
MKDMRREDRPGLAFFNREYGNALPDCASSEPSQNISRPPAETSVDSSLAGTSKGLSHGAYLTWEPRRKQDGSHLLRSFRLSTEPEKELNAYHRRYRAEHGAMLNARRRALYRVQRERPTNHDAAPEPGPFALVYRCSRSTPPNCHFCHFSARPTWLAGGKAGSATRCSIMRSEMTRARPGHPRTEWVWVHRNCHSEFR